MSTPPFAVPPLSYSRTVTVAARMRSAPACRSASRWRDARLHGEERVVVVGRREGQRLAALVRAGPRSCRRPPWTVCAPASSSTVWSAPFGEARRVVDRRHVIVNVCDALTSTPPFAVPPLSLASSVIVAAPLALRRRRVGQRAGRRDRRVRREETRIRVTGDEEAHRLPALVGRPGADARRPLATRLRPASSSTVWSAPFVKHGASFTGVTVIVKVCGALVSTPPFGRAAVVRSA